MTKPHEYIAFALDVSDAQQAENFILTLEPFVGSFKVGLEPFIKTGRTFMELTTNPIILDLKLHDIPETVERAIKSDGDRGVNFMTLHVQQKATLEKAVKAAEPFGIKLLCVTLLTSMNSDDCADLWYGSLHPSSRVDLMAEFAHSCGIRGFVCSPKDKALIVEKSKSIIKLRELIRTGFDERGYRPSPQAGEVLKHLEAELGKMAAEWIFTHSTLVLDS